MAQRLEQYVCSVCGGRVVVMRGGPGIPACCGQTMSVHTETPEEAAARRALSADQLPVRECAACKMAVVVLGPSAGLLACCERPMQTTKKHEEPDPNGASLAVPSMEYNLTMPMKLVLDFIQQRMGVATYFGIPVRKNPLDFWVYQELFFALRPDVIIEIGTFRGGALLAYAHWLDQMGHGQLIGVDIAHGAVPRAVRTHPRITLITGDACERFGDVRRLIQDGEKVLIIEDSSHTYENTLNVLRAYCGLVLPGSYFIVEDSCCRHGVDDGPSPGPYEAIIAFLEEHPEFESDRSLESFLITWNPMGYLRRRPA